MNSPTPPRWASLLALATLTSPALPAQGFDAEVSGVGSGLFLTLSVIGDLDGDGDQDIAGLGFVSGAVWSENLGDGTFLFERRLDFEPPSGTVRDVLASDLDGDGDDDLILAADGAPGVQWIESLGGGAFAPAAPLSTATYGATGVGLTDLDGDGLADLIVVRFLEAPLWRPGLGGGAFGPETLLGTSGNQYSAFETGDIDLDGDVDILLAPTFVNEIRWLENLGAGTFAPEALLTATPADSTDLYLADFEGDGDLDIAFRNEQFSVGGLYWSPNLGGATFGAFSGLPGLSARSAVAADIDGDGRADLAYSTQGPTPMGWYRSTGAGFSGPTTIPSSGSAVSHLTAGDVNGDGDADLVSLNIVQMELHRQGPAGFEPSVALWLGVDPEAVVDLGDVDGDGLSDLLLSAQSGAGTVYLLLNAGSNGWREPAASFGVVDPLQGELVDLDGDGDLDVVASGGSFNQISASVAWIENLGGGAFAPGLNLHADFADSGATYEIGDMEGDGDLDILWTHRAGFAQFFRYEWIEQLSPGQFATGAVLPNNSLTQDFDLADIDGDGDSDIVLSFGPASGRITWRANGGSGAFGPDQTIAASGAHSGSPFGGSLTAEDLDGDGTVDVLAFGDGVEWYPGIAGGSFGAPIEIEPPTGTVTDALLRDVNQDGRVDVFVSSANAPARWFENLGGGAFGPSRRLLEDDLGSAAVAVGDLDGDLDLDVLKQTSTRTLAWNLNKARFGEAYCGPAATNSTGKFGAMSARGSLDVLANDLHLIAERLPVGSFGYFLVATETNLVPVLPNSQGRLCVGGTIGRLNRGPSEIFVTGASGTASVRLNVNNVPTPTGATALAPGDTRYFQAWYRDANPQATSNLTNGLSIRVE